MHDRIMHTAEPPPNDPAPAAPPAPTAAGDDWRPAQAAAAWLLPGLGHVLIGQRTRGLIIGCTILGLWLAGLLIGGISVIDHKPTGDGGRQRFSLWFLGQAMLSPSLAVNVAHQQLKHVSMQRFDHPPQPEDQPRPIFTPALGRVAEIGTLYTALAGLLNLLAIMDVAWGRPRPPRSPQDTSPPSPPPSEAAAP